MHERTKQKRTVRDGRTDGRGDSHARTCMQQRATTIFFVCECVCVYALRVCHHHAPGSDPPFCNRRPRCDVFCRSDRDRPKLLVSACLKRVDLRNAGSVSKSAGPGVGRYGWIPRNCFSRSGLILLLWGFTHDMMTTTTTQWPAGLLPNRFVFIPWKERTKKKQAQQSGHEKVALTRRCRRRHHCRKFEG